MAKQSDVLMLLGRAFHKVAAATTNELSLAFKLKGKKKLNISWHTPNRVNIK